MKKYFRLVLVSILSVCFLTSCCKFGYRKNCSSDCHSKKHDQDKKEKNSDKSDKKSSESNKNKSKTNK